jgi:sulfate transport system ATP-binding protein
MSIEVRSVRKAFGDFVAVDDVSLHVDAGELVALLGPSGSGKTTLLRLVAGLETPDRGSVLFEGADTLGRRASERGVGFVFQHYALFRHMSVFENVAFPLRVRPRKGRPKEPEIRRRVHELLSLVQLDSLGDRLPSQLSGGQRQRVALARALAVEPKVLLLDEPFGSLDARVRLELRRWLRRLHDEIALTSVFVTHDQEEALDVADRVVVMNRGRVEQVGTPDEVFERPATPFVMGFLGNADVFHGADGTAAGYIRPYELQLERRENGAPGVWATLGRVSSAGALVKLELGDAAGRTLHVEMSRERHAAVRPHVGERFHVVPKNVRVFEEELATAS